MAYCGLRPFGIQEAHWGDEVLMKLAETGLLQSSVHPVNFINFCGLIPTLYGGFMTEAGSNWKVIVMRPGGGPIDNLNLFSLKKKLQ